MLTSTVLVASFSGPRSPTTSVDDSATINIDASKVLHLTNPMYMGCHSDSGFVHQVTGWSSQMLFGESFERPPASTKPGQSAYAWQPVVDSAVAGRATVALDPAHNFSGWPSMSISLTTGKAAAGVAGIGNRGLGNEGLYLQSGKQYEGYFFAKSEAAVTLEVRLVGGANFSETLASQRIQHAPPAAGAPPDSKANPGWVRHEFTLTPAKAAECVGIAPGSDPSVHCTDNPNSPHICVKCGGQFVVGVAGGAPAVAAHVAYVVLQPGAWGRFAGLNARRDVAEAMREMGIKAIRLGGSFCSVTKQDGAYYQWPKWTGPVWDRPSVGAQWNSYGHDAYNLIGGWGPFEMIDYAVALGAEPIITTTRSSSPAELADLVEYCWGNASTTLGARRAADGHAAPYQLRYVELGNEEYNDRYLEQVAAMEARATAVGAPPVHYLFPDNGGLKGADVAKAAALGLGARLVTDLHVGAGGALAEASKLFATHASGGLADDGAVNLETNAGTHHHGRALAEAADLNAFFNAGSARMLARTSSFCHGRSGHYDEFDQAISFFLPNMSWLQPPGHVHAMIARSWRPHVVNATVVPAGAPPPTWSTVAGKSLRCSGAEYRGTAPMAGGPSAAGCLAAAEAMEQQGVNYAVYPGNANCYVCAIDGGPAAVAPRLAPAANATSFVGKNVVEPTSVSAQLSADRLTLVARIVNHGGPTAATLRLAGFATATASAVTLASDDLDADNTPSDVDRVAPRPLDAQAEGGTVTVALPGHSFTVVTMAA